MTYEEYRAARDAEEAEAEARRKAEREARRAAELAKTPEERQAELEAMPFEEQYAREKMTETLRRSLDSELVARISSLSDSLNRNEAEARAEADSELAQPISRNSYKPLPMDPGFVGLGKIETIDLRAVNDAIASADVDPVKTWLDRVIPPSQRWFSWLMIAWLAAVSAIILIGR